MRNLLLREISSLRILSFIITDIAQLKTIFFDNSILFYLSLFIIKALNEV